MNELIEKILIEPEEIQERVKELGRKISEDYHGKEVLLVCILKGAFVFLADLIRSLDIPVKVDFIACSSYGSSTESSGVVRILKDLDYPVERKHILLIEDIVDTGLTLNYILSILRERRPLSLKVCALLDKPERRIVPVNVDYLGFKIPNEFVVGYGLDFNGHYRNLPFIAVLKKEVYSQK